MEGGDLESRLRKGFETFTLRDRLAVALEVAYAMRELHSATHLSFMQTFTQVSTCAIKKITHTIVGNVLVNFVLWKKKKKKKKNNGK